MSLGIRYMGTKRQIAVDVKKLPKSLRTRLAECFDNYNHNAPSGVTAITEVMEGLVLKAGREASNKQWISSADARPGQSARTLAALQSATQMNNATAALAAAQAYISMYRNLSHHFPKDKKQAAARYQDCRHAFLDGMKKISFFRDAVKKVGLSGAV